MRPGFQARTGLHRLENAGLPCGEIVPVPRAVNEARDKEEDQGKSRGEAGPAPRPNRRSALRGFHDAHRLVYTIPKDLQGCNEALDG